MPDDKSLHGIPESGEFYRWQGHIDSELTHHGQRLNIINGDISRIKDTLSDMNVTLNKEMAALKAKVALFSAIGGIVGAGAVSLLFATLAQ